MGASVEKSLITFSSEEWLLCRVTSRSPLATVETHWRKKHGNLPKEDMILRILPQVKKT